MVQTAEDLQLQSKPPSHIYSQSFEVVWQIHILGNEQDFNVSIFQHILSDTVKGSYFRSVRFSDCTVRWKRNYCLKVAPKHNIFVT